MSRERVLDSLPRKRAQPPLAQLLNEVGALAAPTFPPAMSGRHLTKFDARRAPNAKTRAKGDDKRCGCSKLVVDEFPLLVLELGLSVRIRHRALLTRTELLLHLCDGGGGAWWWWR
jgi:hypothetical protein